MGPTPDPPAGEHAAPSELPSGDLGAVLSRPEAPVPPEFRKPREAALPFDELLVRQALSHPLHAIDITLAAPDRVGANLVAGTSLGRIALVFLVTATLYAIPYGCVISFAEWWKIVALTLGTTAICLPSLFVFSSFLGQRLRLEQILVLGLTIPAVAALFSLGFAPILAFLRATMSEQESQFPWRSISNVLLAVSVFAGVAQLWRTWLAARVASPSNLFALVLMLWHAVFFHVLLRMGSVLLLGG